MEIKERIENINFHDGLEELSFLHISDIHLKISTLILKKLESIIENVKPKFIVLTGDYYDLPKGAKNFRKFLVKISKKYLLLFIYGNHDKIYGKKISNLLLKIPNCICLENELYKFKSKYGFIYNITSWKNRKKLPFNQNEKNIVLMHNPENIIDSELSNIHLILAGHLHGGQFIFYRTKSNNNFPACMLYKNCSDRKIIKSTTLIVSKGLGDTFPLRFNCPKEVVKICII